MRKVYLKIAIMVFFNEKTKTEKAMNDVLNKSDYDFFGGAGFDVINTEMEGIEKTPKLNQALVKFDVVINMNEGLKIEEVLRNIEIIAPEIIKIEMKDFEVIDSK